jgi:ubiquinone/menaquinone biosynthesis C-methylase UbiE
MSWLSLEQVRHHVHRLLHPRRKMAFIYSIPKSAKVLDVGCGNSSPLITKRARPDLRYTGLDVCDYEQRVPASDYSEEYVVVSPEKFAAEIVKRPNSYDAVICCHNLEHCTQQEQALIGMLRALRKNGTIFLAFPCADSIRFPSREGTLNFFDDQTHTTPPDYAWILDRLREEGFKITFARRRYRPWRLFMIGLLLEPMSRMKKKVIRGTWSLYGFESIIWAKKT